MKEYHLPGVATVRIGELEPVEARDVRLHFAFRSAYRAWGAHTHWLAQVLSKPDPWKVLSILALDGPPSVRPRFAPIAAGNLWTMIGPLGSFLRPRSSFVPRWPGKMPHIDVEGSLSRYLDTRSFSETPSDSSCYSASRRAK